MDLSIIIVNWNTRDLLVNCLNSIQENLGAAPALQAETFVVDNASSDGSAERIRSSFPWVHLIENQDNVGFARANNQAAALAQGKYILLLNPDTVLQPSAIKTMLAYLDTHRDVGAVGPRVLNPNGSVQVSVHPFPNLIRETWRLMHLDNILPLSEYPLSILRSDSSLQVDVLMGVCTLLRADVLDQVGFFDEQFFVYSEEVDLCLRIHQNGWRVYWLPKAVITHYSGQSTNQVPDKMFVELFRNKVKYFRKHFGNTQASLYKTLLYFVSVNRYIPGVIASLFPSSAKNDRVRRALQYRLLIEALPDL